MKYISYITTLVLFPLFSFAQGGSGLGASILAQTTDSVKIRTVANFPFGSGTFCPPLVGFRQSTHSDTLQVNLFYDLSGAWPAHFCVSIDTITLAKQQQRHLNIRGNSIHPSLNTDTIYSGYKVVLPLSVLNISKNNDAIFGFTNPVKNNILSVYCNDLPNNATISIFSIEGKPILSKVVFDKNYIDLDLSSCTNGLYLMQIESPTFRIVKKIVLLKT
jgi:Secretion system C-terminal sorting domain